MDEILQKLLSSELLSEDAKTEISTQWTNSITEYKTMVRESVEVEVRSEIAEQWANERDTLIESVDEYVSKKLVEEIAELKSDIESFRDLEVEFAEKIVEEKHAMATTLAEELDQLIDKMDTFFELRLTEEFNELREDLEVVKQNEFGRRIFETFASEFSKSYVDEDSIQSKLSVAQAKLKDATKTINALEESQNLMVRESKLEKILSNLNGKKKEQMQFVLQNVETSRLEEAYSHFIGRVLEKETTEVTGDKQIIKESANVVVTGDANSSQIQQATSSDKLSNLRKLAGITPTRN